MGQNRVSRLTSVNYANKGLENNQDLTGNSHSDGKGE